MAAALPVAKRITYANLQPGDIVFWSTAPNGVNTASATVYHTGIYLGKGWTINSHGCGDGVTLDYMGAGAGLVPRRVRVRLARHARRTLTHRGAIA